ncbi:DUF5659 domain-containing protein [Gottfriedia acidiceleris]|uniref:DUF5659 domain-containing protein n=1 Tax=Gottfriedia acidiceleris TaxID=371036 RepID=UPI002FFDB33A
MATKQIFSTRMVNYLLKNKAELMQVSSDKKDRNKLVFYFVDNEILKELINKYPH